MKLLIYISTILLGALLLVGLVAAWGAGLGAGADLLVQLYPEWLVNLCLWFGDMVGKGALALIAIVLAILGYFIARNRESGAGRV